MEALLHAMPDPRSPHETHGFEPRDAEGGNIWAFGQPHAVVHHVLHTVSSGDAMGAADAFDSFAAMHQLSFGLHAARARVLEDAVRRVVGQAVKQPAPGETTNPSATESPARGVKVLVFDAGIGGKTLRCLPGLLGAPAPLLRGAGGGPDGDLLGVHEVVSIEHNADLSSFGARLVSHAVGEAPLRHFPMMVGEDTTLDETLQSLHEGYELSAFDLVLLGDGDGGRGDQKEQLAALVRQGSLRDGAVVHAEGPAESDKRTAEYLDALRGVGENAAGGPPGAFENEVRDLGDGKAAVVSTWRERQDEL